MKCRHYRNEPLDSISLVSPNVLSSLEAELLKEDDILDEDYVSISLDSYELKKDDAIFPIGASYDFTPEGEFFVVEKWEYPYWKRDGLVYTPSEDNPIGKYLMILADIESGNKIPTSIHTFPEVLYGDFRQGDVSKGCIRLRKNDMENLFFSTPLGARVFIDY